MSSDAALRDFHSRIAQYQRTYVPVQEDEGSFVKLVGAGTQVISHRIQGYLPSRLVFFLMQIQPTDRPIWLTRHGESEFNVLGRIGGDAPLTERGQSYASALATRPRVLLLDEPAAGVPKEESGELFAAIAGLSQDLTILFIEHDMAVVFRFASRILVMVGGRILVEGTPAEISADERVREVYLGKRHRAAA
jgi:hypothetical protein